MLALALAPGGFTVAAFTAQVHAATGWTDTDYSTRQGAPRPAQTARQTAGHPKPACPGAYQVPDPAARTIAAPLSLRDEVICPILAGIC